MSLKPMAHVIAPLVVFGALVLGGSQIGDETPTASPEMRLQKAHRAAVTHKVRLDHQATSVPDRIFELGGEGFAGLFVDEVENSITTYWKGAAPAQLVAYARTRPSGVRIRLVENAPYSRSDLSAAASRVMSSQAGIAAGVSLISPKVDGTGLKIGVLGLVPSEEQQAAIASVAGVPVDAITFTPNSGIRQEPGILRSPTS